MDAGPALNVHPILAVTIVTALPVVAFALWADYYSRYIDEAAKQTGDDALDRPTELRRARWAGIYSFLVLASIYLSTSSIRQEHSLPCLLIFVTAICLQSHIQASLEKKIRGSEAPPKDHFKVFANAMMWTLGSLFFYFSIIWGSLYAGHRLLMQTSLQGVAAVWTLAAIGITAIFTATALLLALTPFHLRKMLPVSRIQDEELKKRLESSFTKAGFRAPEMWMLELDDFRFTNALISGFSGGSGIFRPSLFLSRALLMKLSRPEIEAVVLHEVSHWSLKHMRRRFVGSLLAIAASTVVLSVFFVLAQMFLSPAGQALMRVATTVAALLVPYFLVRTQTERHELEADRHCVLELGASLESFASALRKIDRLNDLDGASADPYAQIIGSHPLTEMRILRLRHAWEMKQALNQAEEKQESFDHAA